MKIALLAPFEEPVPPLRYGGTEVVVYNLITEFIRMGHEVTLFASGDSKAPCELVPIVPEAIRTKPPYSQDMGAREAIKFAGAATMVSEVGKRTFDIVHNHCNWRILAFSKLIPHPMVTTLHGRMDVSYYPVVFSQDAIKHQPLVSISHNQRRSMPHLNYVATVYNGIDIDQYPYSEKHDDYLLFLARFSPEKGAREAIEVAKRTGKKLLMAVKVDAVDRAYFEAAKPLIDGKQIVLLGELTMAEKVRSLQGAAALLAPIQWEEPFGLFVVEAMACGTPVLGMRRGSFPELIDHGRNGFLATTVEEMVEHVGMISSIDRRVCRRTVEMRFNKHIMSANYIKVYQDIIRSAGKPID